MLVQEIEGSLILRLVINIEVMGPSGDKVNIDILVAQLALNASGAPPLPQPTANKSVGKTQIIEYPALFCAIDSFVDFAFWKTSLFETFTQRLLGTVACV